MNNPSIIYQSNSVLQRCFFSHSSLMYPTVHHAPPEEAVLQVVQLTVLCKAWGWMGSNEKKENLKQAYLYF